MNENMLHIYSFLAQAKAFLIKGTIFSNFVLMGQEEIKEEMSDEENPIVLSIYDTEHFGDEKTDYYFDSQDLENASINNNYLIMSDEDGSPVCINILVPLVLK